jgi:gas vesicle protein
MEDENRISYFFLGLGLGVAVGVLFAPKSGEETRDMIRSKANEGADYMKRRGEEFRDQASDAIDRGKQTIQKHKDNLSAAVDAGRQAYRDAVNSPLNTSLNNPTE